MSNETVFANARIVREGDIVAGTLLVRDGHIASLDTSRAAPPDAIDCQGDLVLPGLIELHTDHLEQHCRPRPGVRWDTRVAIQSHDAQIATAGITTVFDAICLGMDEERFETEELRALSHICEAMEADGHLRANHFLHLRCEVCSSNVVDAFEAFGDDPAVRLVSLMDHTPGQRQFVSLERHKEYYQGTRGINDEEYEAFVRERQEQAGRHSRRNRTAIAEQCRARAIVLASHDDATRAHVAEAAADGVGIAEFPTTVEAAEASRQSAMKVLMGAPNLVRGRSHSGNVSARALAEAGMLDILSSDYVPFSLLQAVFLLTAEDVQTLPEALRLVTAVPADAVGLSDRGRIAPGLRADLVRVHESAHGPIVRGVWNGGHRVA